MVVAQREERTGHHRLGRSEPALLDELLGLRERRRAHKKWSTVEVQAGERRSHGVTLVRPGGNALLHRLER